MSWLRSSFCRRHQWAEARPATFCRTPLRNWWHSLALLPSSATSNRSRPIPRQRWKTARLGTSKGCTGSIQNCSRGCSGWNVPRPRVDLQRLVAELPHFGGWLAAMLSRYFFRLHLSHCSSSRQNSCPTRRGLHLKAGCLLPDVSTWASSHWVVPSSKTPASYNASMTMTQGVAAGGRRSRSPSTKKLPCNCLLKSLGLLSGVSNLTCLESPFLRSSSQFAAAWPWEPWIAARHSFFKTETLTLKDYQPCLS